MTDLVKGIAIAIQNLKNDCKIDLLAEQLTKERLHYQNYKNSLELELKKCDSIIELFDSEINNLKERKEVKNEQKEN